MRRRRHLTDAECRALDRHRSAVALAREALDAHLADCAQQILALRERGVTVRAIAEQLNVSVSTVHHWEKQARGG